MKVQKKYAVEDTNSFVESFSISPYKKGDLTGLTFSVKDTMNIKGYKSTCGNPDWLETHPVAVSHAVCVEQMLCAGAECIGKTVTDELSFGLDGENHFYGTPLNPKAPDRVPGGSSSGSASAVACNLVDFDFGTDAGGSVRIPASNCGILGIRPSHGAIMNSGVQPFAPSFDTVGFFASDVDIFTRVAQVAFSQPAPQNDEPKSIYILQDAFAICDDGIKETYTDMLKEHPCFTKENVQFITLQQIFKGEINLDLNYFRDIFNTIQFSETWATYGDWIESAKPTFGPRVERNFDNAKHIARDKLGDCILTRAKLFRGMNKFLQDNNTVLCFPTTPCLAPIKDSLGSNQTAGNYYPRTLALSSIAGLCRLPEITVPLATVEQTPIGLSFLGHHGTDINLVSFINRLMKRL